MNQEPVAIKIFQIDKFALAAIAARAERKKGDRHPNDNNPRRLILLGAIRLPMERPFPDDIEVLTLHDQL
jgi:hypothetical protein